MTTYTTSDRDLVTQEVSNVSGTTTHAYNEHGRQTSETDARTVTVSRTYDALDRLTFIDYPDGDMDTTFTYDDPGVAFSIGRLTAIDRGGLTDIGYGYDRFGRRTQDGDLTFSYDKNGNALTVGYPAGVTATYTYDFADRQATLVAQDGANPSQTLVSASSYKPAGPLASLTLGNGLTEAHSFTSRYFPSSVTVGSLLSWTYGTDSLGNPTSITDTLNSANDRTYAYQDNQYFLTTGNGPWGSRSWTYDKIGNRLTETRGATTDTYSYLTNGASGHKAQIDQVNSTATYDYDAAGEVLTDGTLSFNYGDDRRTSLTYSGSPWPRTDSTYDGRGLLSSSIFTRTFGAFDTDQSYPTYSSAGLFLHLNTHRAAKLLPVTPASDGDSFTFYFSGRPVATLDKVTQSSTTTSTLRYLSTDSLGTPVLVTSTAGAQVWQGGFEPFGADYSSSPTRLRFPGQWLDSTFQGPSYNVNRWYGSDAGRYTQPDPLSVSAGPNPYVYVANRPTRFFDLEGLFLQNNTNCTLYIKESTRGKTHAVSPGQQYSQEIDGYADPCNHPNQVYKTTDLVDVTVDKDHKPHTSVRDDMTPLWESFGSHFSTEGSTSFSFRGGWHDSSFKAKLDKNGDTGWDELFDKSQKKNCACVCQLNP